MTEEKKEMLKKGDFITVDYTAKIKETGKIFDTTIEEASKKEHMEKKGEVFEPKLVIIGEGWVLKALDDSFATMEVEKQSVVEIPPDKAFGQRDNNNLKHVSLRNLREQGLAPVVGMRLEYGGKTAIVRTIESGRVMLDFNTPLAGKTLVYEVTIKKKLEIEEEKLRALIHRRIPSVDISKFGLTLEGKAIIVTMPSETFYLDGIQQSKRGILADIDRFFPSTTALTFVEPFKVEKKEVPQPTEEQKAMAKGAVQVLNGEHK